MAVAAGAAVAVAVQDLAGPRPAPDPGPGPEVQDQATRSRPGIQYQEQICLMKIMKFDLKWVHMARYELILRLDEAICFTVIFQPLLAHQRPMDGPKIPKEFP